jgi:MFS superfamily sulfate permease-like transporter
MDPKTSRRLQWGLGEWTGALGDLGTFAPIYLALVALAGLAPVPSLLLVGTVYVAGSLCFRTVVPVQPLKAAAALVLAQGMGAPMLAAAGVWLGLVLAVLVATRSVGRVGRFFTRPIVKGLQLGVGLMLVKVGLGLMASGHVPAAIGRVAPPLDGWGALSSFWLLALPQLPLTLGNSVFAAAETARESFGEEAARMTPRGLCVSLALANLAAGALGAMPICHGSGGITAHRRFGARTAGATVIAGTLYILLALVFASRAPAVLRAIPPAGLGAMMVYVGLCHALLLRGLAERLWLAWAVGLVGLLTGNLAWALGLGLLVEEGGVWAKYWPSALA